MAATLVVDDERTIADTLTLILRHAGYAAKCAYSAEEALEYLSGHGVDLIVSDVVMPGMNGIELALRVREAQPRCEILLISGNATTQDLLEGARQRGHQFTLLAKPIPPIALLELVKATLRHAGRGTGVTTSISAAA